MSGLPLEYLHHFDTLNFWLSIHVWRRFWFKKFVIPFGRYIAHVFISLKWVSEGPFTPGGLNTEAMTRRLRCWPRQSRQGIELLVTRTCLQKWQQMSSKIGGDLCWFLWWSVWLGEASKKFLFWASIFGNIWGETFFMASVEKINSVCNVPSEANKKDYNLESHLSLLPLWKSVCHYDVGTQGGLVGP